MSMKDYPQPSWRTQAPNVGIPPLGPAQSPVKTQECVDGGESKARVDTCAIKNGVQTLVQQQSDQNDGITSHMPPPWAIWAFPEDNAPVLVPAIAQGGAVIVAVATKTIPEGYFGTVEFLGLVVIPETANNDIRWQVQIDSRPVTWADNIVCNFNTFYEPTKYRLSLQQRQTISVWATNNGPFDLLCVSKIVLWISPMRKY